MTERIATLSELESWSLADVIKCNDALDAIAEARSSEK